MGGGPQSQTGPATKGFFQNPTEQGWEGFVDHYGPKMYAWCRGNGLQPADAHDVVQDVMLRLHRSMERSSWDPQRGRLRTWLRRVTLNALNDYLRQKGFQTQAPELLQSIAESHEQFAEELAAEEEQRIAQSQTRLRVGTKKWEVFRLRVYECLSSDEVSQQLGLTVGTVYNYFGEVSRVLADELQKLETASDRVDLS